jgi:hypothetical protein
MKSLLWTGVAAVALVVGLVIGRTAQQPSRDLLDLSRVVGIEKARQTDPSGRLDSVLIMLSYGGAAGGGVNWYVSFVPKGQPASVAKQAVFLATSARDISLSWRQSHLLEIRYKRAQILQFTNLWDTNELGTKWFSAEEPDEIEIRLVPSSTDFSILKPDGGFQ